MSSVAENTPEERIMASEYSQGIDRLLMSALLPSSSGTDVLGGSEAWGGGEGDPRGKITLGSVEEVLARMVSKLIFQDDHRPGTWWRGKGIDRIILANPHILLVQSTGASGGGEGPGSASSDAPRRKKKGGDSESISVSSRKRKKRT